MPAKKKTAPPAARKPRKAAAPKATPTGPPEGDRLARLTAGYADDKKAENIVILDVRGISMVADFLVICDGGSLPHLRAIRNEISDRLREEHKVKPYAAHGSPDSGWMLLDYGDVVIHIFHAEKRSFYALEDLWNDAPRLA
jgi:ribosome-associated protein